MTKQIPFLDLNAQHAPLREELDAALDRVILTSDFVLGEDVDAFEKEFAEYCGVDHCVGVASGTDALALILDALEIGPGDEVITVANTFIATALAIADVRATLVLCDIDPATRNIDPNQVEATINGQTRAIIAVHLYGYPADMDELGEIARRHGIFLVEDACQAHGSIYRGRKAGGLSDAAAFSFYPGKNLGAFGDAGAVVTNSADIAHKVRVLRNVGQDGKYHHVVKGRNSRLDNLQAAVLRVKLPYVDDWNASRARVAATYDRLLAGAEIGMPPQAPDRTNSQHLYVVEVDRRDEVLAAMATRGVSTLIHYPSPIHLQPAFAELGLGPGSLPHAEASAARVLSLPMFAELTDDDAGYVAESLLAVMIEVRAAR